MSHRRELARVQAMARQAFSPETLISALMPVIGRKIALPPPPAFLVLPAGFTSMADFTVWNGVETHSDELRGFLRTGCWPGPRSMPRLDETIRRNAGPYVHAATLYGEGAEEEGPWTAMWRERRITHALQAVVVSPAGRTGFLMAARGPALRPFSAADIAFVEDAVPHLSAAMEAKADDDPSALTPDAATSLFFDRTGHLTGMGPDGLDWLRDIGGGGPDGRIQGRVQVEAIAREAAQRAQGAPAACTTIDGEDEDATLRQQVFAVRYGPEAAAIGYGNPQLVTENGYGRFELSLRPMIGMGAGEGQRMGTLVRKVPLALIVLRGAAQLGLAPRQIELAVQLARGATLDNAAAGLGISASTAKTLAKRLFAALGAEDRDGALRALVSTGRSADPRLHLDFQPSPAFA